MRAELDRIFRLAAAHQQEGRWADAESGYRDILGRDPDYVPALGELGRLAFHRGFPDIAATLLARAAALAPGIAHLRDSLAHVLQSQGLFAQAIATLRKNLALHPDYVDSYNNLGNVLKATDSADKAVSIFRRALALDPRNWAVWSNLGTALHQMQCDDAAAAAYRTALSLSDNPDVHHNLSHALLASGRLAEAWPEYEWRSQAVDHRATWPRFTTRRWRGEPAPGRTLLVHAEQGMGDMLQFCRYVPLLADRGMRIVLQVHRPLVRLMRSLAGVADVVARGDELPPFDMHCPMLSLPQIFGTTLETIPAHVPYLSATAEDVAAWQQRLGPHVRPRVGISWAGNPQLGADRRRSIAVENLDPILQGLDIDFHSLQYDAATPAGMIASMASVADFADTAALISSLDLVVAVDSAVAHLAGSIGGPIWLLNRFDAEWRWLRQRNDSPWYPTMRQFRQKVPADWRSVILEVRAELESWAACWAPE